MALAIVEEGTRDAWCVAVPGWVEDAPTTNAISPPISYGEVRAGMEHSDSTALLVAGRTYTFSLWRVLPQGSTVPCQGRIGRACLVATTTFRR